MAGAGERGYGASDPETRINYLILVDVESAGVPASSVPP